MNAIKHKLFTTKASSIDDESKSVTFVISTNKEDRYGEVVDQKSWDFKSYLKNPLVLWGHNPDEPENVLGTASSLSVADDGSQTTAVLTFDTDINPNAALIFNQIKKGTLRTVSVGFINHSYEVEEDVPILSDNELLEISVVPIPANSGAIALGLKAGEITRKDAKWLMDSMRREADLMEKQYEASAPKNKEKSMTPEQADALIAGIAKLTGQVETLTADNQALRDEVATLKPVEESEEDKTSREAKEVEAAKAAADKAEADKKAADEEAARLKAEEEEKNPAKSGDDDQDGAGDDDDLDDDAELTPELQEKIDAELEAALV